MVTPTVDDLPAAPDRTTGAAQFDIDAVAWVAAIVAWTAQINALGVFVSDKATETLAAAIAQGLPALAGHTLEAIRVNADETAVEFVPLGSASAKNTGVAVGDVVEVLVGLELPALKTSNLLEKDHDLNGATVLDPANGGRQFDILTANTTFTETLSDGQDFVLMIDDGAGFTVTWPSITWLTSDGSAPPLDATGFNVFVIFQSNTVLYGSVVRAG